MTKIVILDIFCIFYYFCRTVDKTLLCEFSLCRKYTWNRTAGENFTVVPYCPNQSQEPKNGNK